MRPISTSSHHAFTRQQQVKHAHAQHAVDNDKPASSAASAKLCPCLGENTPSD